MSSKNVFLPRSIRPRNYELILEPDLVACTFVGSETIEIDVVESTDSVVLHSLDLEIVSAKVISRGASHDAVTSFDAQMQTAILKLSSALPVGQAQVHIEFKGILTDKLCGFYRSAYTSTGGERRYMAVTQFEPCDARRAFPCFDEPALKASFDITLVVPKDRTAVSNMPVKTEHDVDGGRRRITYERSPIMSTYLVAFVVGEMEFLARTSEDGILVRVFTQKGLSHHGEFAVTVGARAVKFYHDFFNIAYPIAKMDMLAIPDFAAGAMENYGCITYRETRLIIDEKNSSIAGKQATARTIAHEISHQWFGNLVTMQWWTHLWLNEGFARWAEHLAVDHIFPDWDIWTQFVGQVQAVALSLDSLRTTHAIEVDVNDPAEINEIFDTISYAKGASVIRMLEAFLGTEQFRDGLRAYLDRFKYRNASTVDLWAVLSEVSKQPVAELMQSWTRQPGYPVITVKELASTGGKRRLQLSQRRFLKDGSDAGDDSLWLVPVTIFWQGDTGKPVTMILRERTAEVEIDAAADAWIKINKDQAGFYCVNYTPEQWLLLGKAVSAGQLPARDRMGLLNDAFALAGAGLLSTRVVLDMVSSYQHERDFSVLELLATKMAILRAVFEDEPFVEELRAWAGTVFAPVFAEVGLQKRDNEPLLTTRTRTLCIEQMSVANDKTVVEDLISRAHRFLAGETDALPADIRSLGLRTAVKKAAPESDIVDKVLSVYETSNLQEDRARALDAAGSSPLEKNTARMLEYFLTIRTQDAPTLFGSVSSHRVGRDAAWKFLRTRFDDIYAKIGGGQFLMPSIVSSAASRFTTEAAAVEIEEFFKAHPVPGADRTVQQAVERVRFMARWRARDAAVVGEFLHKNSSAAAAAAK